MGVVLIIMFPVCLVLMFVFFGMLRAVLPYVHTRPPSTISPLWRNLIMFSVWAPMLILLSYLVSISMNPPDSFMDDWPHTGSIVLLVLVTLLSILASAHSRYILGGGVKGWLLFMVNIFVGTVCMYGLAGFAILYIAVGSADPGGPTL